MLILVIPLPLGNLSGAISVPQAAYGEYSGLLCVLECFVSVRFTKLSLGGMVQMLCKQLSLQGIEHRWLGSHWKTFVSMHLLPCAWSPAFFLWWEVVRLKRLLRFVWKCFKSLKVSAWACSLGRLSSSAAGEVEWRWLVIQAVQVERNGGKKQALLLHHCLHASCWKLVSSPTLLMAPCSGSSLWENLYWRTRNVVEWRRLWWKQEKGGNCKHDMCKRRRIVYTEKFASVCAASIPL